MQDPQTLKTFVDKNNLIGKMRWLGGIASNFTDTYMPHLLTDEQELCKNVDESSQLNCWGAVFLLGCCSCSDMDVRSTKFGAIKSTKCMEPGYEDALKKQLGIDEWVSYNVSEDEEWDVIFFYGDSHAALSLGGGQVLSLWYGPDDNDTLQVTTIDALMSALKEEPVAYLRALSHWCDEEGCLGFRSGGARWDREKVKRWIMSSRSSASRWRRRPRKIKRSSALR
jgi:hypothetical protein